MGKRNIRMGRIFWIYLVLSTLYQLSGMVYCEEYEEDKADKTYRDSTTDI